MAVIGIKNFLLSLPLGELKKWSEKHNIATSIGLERQADEIVRKYRGKTETFYSKFVSYSLKKIRKEGEEENIDHTVFQRIFYLLLEKKRRKEDVLFKMLSFDFSLRRALNILENRSLILRKYHRNENYYTLSIPNELRQHIRSKLSSSGDIETDHIIGIIDNIIKTDNYPKNLVQGIFIAFSHKNSFTKAELAFACIQNSIGDNNFDLKDSRSLIGYLEEQNILELKENSFQLPKDFQNNLNDILNFLEELEKRNKVQTSHIDFIPSELSKIKNLPVSVILYLSEAVKAYNNKMTLSCSLCLGCGSEILINYLTKSLVSYLDSKFIKNELNKPQLISQKMEKIKTFYQDGVSKRKNVLKQKLQNNGVELSKRDEVIISSEFLNIIEPLFQVFRLSRNDTGHPTINIIPERLPSLTNQYANILAFLKYSEIVMLVSNYLTQASSSS